MTQICKKHTNKSLMKMSENTKFSQTGQGGILFSYLLTHVNFNILQLLGSFFIFFAEIQLWVFVRLQAKCRTSVSCYCQCYKCQYINKSQFTSISPEVFQTIVNLLLCFCRKEDLLNYQVNI